MKLPPERVTLDVGITLITADNSIGMPGDCRRGDGRVVGIGFGR